MQPLSRNLDRSPPPIGRRSQSNFPNGWIDRSRKAHLLNNALRTFCDSSRWRNPLPNPFPSTHIDRGSGPYSVCPNKEMDREQLQIIENLFRLSDFMSSTIRPHALRPRIQKRFQWHVQPRNRRDSSLRDSMSEGPSPLVICCPFSSKQTGSPPE